MKGRLKIFVVAPRLPLQLRETGKKGLGKKPIENFLKKFLFVGFPHTLVLLPILLFSNLSHRSELFLVVDAKIHLYH